MVAACGIYTPDVARLVGRRRADHPLRPPVPRHGAVRPAARAAAHAARPRRPRLLPHRGRRPRAGRLRARTPHRGPSTACPDGFEAALLTEDWDRFEELSTNAIRRVPAMETAQVKRFFNGPEAFTPDGEFCLGESRVPGLLGRRRLLRARARRRRRRRQGDGRVDRRRPARVRRLAHGPQALRPPLPQPGATRSPAPTRACRSTTTSSTRPRSARARGRCGSRPPTPGSRRSARRSARRPAGSASTGSSRNAADGDEALRPRGWAGQNWSPAIGAEARATRAAAGIFDQSSFAKLEVVGPGATAFLRAAGANAVDRPVGIVVYTQLLNPRGGIECDLSVTRLGARPLPARHGHGLRRPRPRLDRAAPAGRRPRARARRDLRPAPASASGARGRATSCSRSRAPAWPTTTSRT